ncbi:MAG: DUF4160 domain-containing protein [Deltaproteobacteria bacterium]|nr:DUF4160 domain-containing protein [Deltaproteobacteria bacterium]
MTGDGFRATALQLGEPHQTPHFHAYYGDEVAVFAIEPIELLAGTLPRRQQRFIEAWAELHQEELKKDWDLLQQGRKPVPIRPLE